MKGTLVPKGEAKIEGKFSITKLGTVLQLTEGWTGKFAVGDTMRRGNRQSRITSLEFLDDLTIRQAWICITIEDESLAAEIIAGDIVQFFDSDVADPL